MKRKLNELRVTFTLESQINTEYEMNYNPRIVQPSLRSNFKAQKNFKKKHTKHSGPLTITAIIINNIISIKNIHLR